MSRGYAEAVQARLAALLADGCTSFGALLAGAGGADPRVVADWWREHGGSTQAPEDRGATEAGLRPGLHPLHSEWYFTSDCAQALANRFGDRLLALGTPTVAALAREAILVERDAALIRRRFGPRTPTTVELELGSVHELPDRDALAGPFDAALLDPPWYAPHPRRWLALAGRRVRLGGTLAMVVPPELQRPTAERERSDALALARRFGPTTLESGAVRYATPRFERLALAQAGIDVPAAWRTADLLVTRVESREVEVEAPHDAAAGFETFAVDSQLVLLTTAARPGPPALHAVEGIDGYCWDQITSRDPRVATIDVWTSESRVARVTGRDAIADMLRRIASGMTPSDATDDRGLAADLGRLLGGIRPSRD